MNDRFKICLLAFTFFLIALLLSSRFECYAGSTDPAVSDTVQYYTYKIVNSYPHDMNAFTQGLSVENNILYEGTGLLGRSSLRKVDMITGGILQYLALPDQFFGEGIALYGNKIVQLTWQSRIGFIYDKATLELLKQFTYATEGWGITYDGKHWIMSDGTSTLRFLDPDTSNEIGQIEVYDKNGPVSSLNELEYVKGEVFANVWKTDRIARIAPKTGQVTGWIQLKGILKPEMRGGHVDVLNGIAYDSATNRLFVTGKHWPRIFEIVLIPVE